MILPHWRTVFQAWTLAEMVQWRRQDISSQQERRELSESEGAVEDYQFFSVSTLSDWYVRPAMILTAFALFCGLLFNGANNLWSWLDRPVMQLKMTDNTQYLNSDKMLSRLALNLSAAANSNKILSLDIDEIRKIALEEPWVNAVQLQRRWPPAISIEVREQVPVAKWGDRGLLNHQGDIFWPKPIVALAHLPQLNGPSTDTARVMDQYHTLSQFFKGSDTLMSGLTLQARGAWTLLLENNIEVELGREHILTRLQRFLELYKGHLHQLAAKIERVDVRYTNGLSVQWRPVKPIK